MNDIWNKRFMDLAAHVAGWSKDPSKQVGAVIVNSNKHVLSMGYNGFPRGVDDNPGCYSNKPLKRLWISHAERNALDNAPTSVEGATLYSTLFPCNECAKGIIQRGIARVVTHDWDRHDNNMLDAYNFDTSERLFDMAKIELILLK
jgi:dCMP deaminase